MSLEWSGGGHRERAPHREEGSREGGEPVERIEYTLGRGIEARLTLRSFAPRGIIEAGSHEGRTLIFLPGTLLTAADRSVEGLCRAYADASGNGTIAISASVERTAAHKGKRFDMLAQEARGIERYVRENIRGEVVLIGHSRGGNEAIELAALLEKGSGNVGGVILLDSAGLYEASDAERIASLAMTPARLSADALRSIGDPEAFNRSVGVVQDMMANAASEAMRFGPAFPGRFMQDATKANVVNKKLSRVRAPKVIFTAEHDPIADARRIVTPEEQHRTEKRFSHIADVNERARVAWDAALHEKVPNSTFILKESAGHTYPIEQPEDTAAETLRALNALAMERTIH